jgi:hypothetical protein
VQLVSFAATASCRLQALHVVHMCSTVLNKHRACDGCDSLSCWTATLSCDVRVRMLHEGNIGRCRANDRISGQPPAFLIQGFSWPRVHTCHCWHVTAMPTLQVDCRAGDCCCHLVACCNCTLVLAKISDRQWLSHFYTSACCQQRHATLRAIQALYTPGCSCT